MRWPVLLVLALILLPAALGHEEDFLHEEDSELGMEERWLATAAWVMAIAGIIVIVFTILALHFKDRCGPVGCWVLFLGIVLPVLAATAYSAITTITLNQLAETKGPVHWHADFEIWVCGRLMELQPPSGISNRLGTALLHEHGDLRIHAEGVLLRRENAALGKFFTVIGGLLSRTTIVVPTPRGLVEANNGDRCPDGTPGTLQVFRLYPQNDVIVQEKLADPARYVMAPESLVPPGDCLIIEFGPEQATTNRLCASYRAAIARGALHGG